MLMRICIALLCFATFPIALVYAAIGVLQIRVRDVQTGYSVKARVKLEGPRTLSAETDELGCLRLSLPPGEYSEEVAAPRYERMRSHMSVQAGKTSPQGFMLDPVIPPPEGKRFSRSSRRGSRCLHGYAVDERGRPASGVRVYLQKAHVAAVTNERGYYWLSVPTPPEESKWLRGIDNLLVKKAGYKTIVHRNIFIGGADGRGYLLDLVRGPGRIELDDTHHLMK